MERRMAFLFVVALLLIGWQAWRIVPSFLPNYRLAVEPGEQLYPVAAPLFRRPVEIPAEPDARRRALAEQSVPWPGRTSPADCDLFVRMSSHHWARAAVSRSELARLGGGNGRPQGAGPVLLHLAPGALADDDDRDGDTLDAGELSAASGRIEAEVFCGPRPEVPL